jgi:RND family efflux transporter MFP subunit
VIFMFSFGSIVRSSASKIFGRWYRRSLYLALCIGPLASEPDAHAAPQIPPAVNARTFDCIIEPQQIVKLASPVLGVVARLDVDRGDLVREGQIVGKIEDGVEAAALALARARATNEFTANAIRARLEFLRKKHFRMDHLHAKAVGSLATVEEAEAEAKVFEQQLKEADLNKELARLQALHAEEVLMQRTLKSPVNGVVVERLLVPGEYRNEQTPVLTLAQIDTLRVEVFVPTAYYGQIALGSKAQVRPEDPIGGAYTATVSVVDRVLDAASGTFGVRLLLANSTLELPAGIRCKITFERNDAAPAVAEKNVD